VKRSSWALRKHPNFQVLAELQQQGRQCRDLWLSVRQFWSGASGLGWALVGRFPWGLSSAAWVPNQDSDSHQLSTSVEGSQGFGDCPEAVLQKP